MLILRHISINISLATVHKEAMQCFMYTHYVAQDSQQQEKKQQFLLKLFILCFFQA